DLQGTLSPSLKMVPCSQGTIRRIVVENPGEEPLSPLLKSGNFGSGNVIYEKTIRKYEFLNPDQCQPLDQCQVTQPCQPLEQPQVIQSCQQFQNGSSCDIGPISVTGDGRGNTTVRRVTYQTCEPLDSRYFGELLAELNRKSNDLYTCLLQHVDKLGVSQVSTWNFPTEDIESLIPNGLSELTKQQIRYLLQMRVTSDKSLRLVLSTFSSLREELCHLQNDLGKLETDKMLLEKDLAFKASQVKEFEILLASVRENNRQQQQALRDSMAKCRTFEQQLLSFRHSEGEKEFRLKDLEYSKRALEQEIQNLRLQASSNPLLQTTADELSSRYVEMINQLREDKDREICNLRSQLNQFQQDLSRRNEGDSDLQLRLLELTSMMDEKETHIKRQEEELFRLRQEKILCNQSPGVTRTIITKRYNNQYPILGLLSDDYKFTPPGKETQTVIIEKTGETWKQVR
uniref:POF1B actin binding protein n=1 Tax=Sphenodon punctatus TaxID=8508 RepID=A0A8D0HC89_SPHPU